MKKQKLTQDEKNEKNFNQLRNVLGRIIQISYDDKTQLREALIEHKSNIQEKNNG